VSLSDRELLTKAEEVEPRFAQITHCTRCERLLGRETVWRRMYSHRSGLIALALLCGACSPSFRSISCSSGVVWRSLRDSNPCYSLERAMSWASRRRERFPGP
jgi:hypothetical protein